MATLSQNITQAISDFDDIKTAIQSKGVTVTSGTPTSDYAEIIGDIPLGNDSVLIGLFNRTATSFTVPEGVTQLPQRIFYEMTSLTNITFPSTLKTIQVDCFTRAGLTGVAFPDSVTNIQEYAFSNLASLASINFPHPPAGSSCGCGARSFQGANALTSVTIPNRVNIATHCFSGCNNLKTAVIENTAIGGNPFSYCSALEFVTLPSGFNGWQLNLSASTLYSAATIVSWLNALADRTGTVANTFTIGSTNLAKLTAEEIAIATNKNWNLA